MRIAFLGLGKMGQLMAGRLLGAGHDVAVWNRTAERGDGLVARGARRGDSPADAATRVDVIVTMLFDAAAVREVLLDGSEAAAEGAAEGTLVVDTSTIGPEAARGLGAALGERGLRFVDAPVAGSTPLAEKGKLGSFLGGSDDDVAVAREVVLAWAAADKVRHVGAVGSGQAVKLVVNTSLGAAIAAVGECLRLARDLGVEEGLALDALAGSPLAGVVGQKRAMLEAQDYLPATFAVDAMTKDLHLAVDTAQGRLSITRAALQEAESALSAGHGSEDIAALAGHLAYEGEADSY